MTAFTSPASRLRPLSEWPEDARAGLRGVLTDIDDTLTTNGSVAASTLQALSDLRSAGLHVIAITGRPVGWSLPFAATWSIDAIVAENGSVALVRGNDGAVRKIYQQPEAQRQANYRHLQHVAQRIQTEIPGAKLALDSEGRETDIAIDHSEFQHLSPEQIHAVVQCMQAEGLHASVSSIHINGWLGDHNKQQGAQWIVQTLLARDLAAERTQWAYIGDSTNDQLLFGWLPNSVGVANVQRFLPQLQQLPAYITPSERGAGFEEMALAILASRHTGAFSLSGHPC